MLQAQFEFTIICRLVLCDRLLDHYSRPLTWNVSVYIIFRITSRRTVNRVSQKMQNARWAIFNFYFKLYLGFITFLCKNWSESKWSKELKIKFELKLCNNSLSYRSNVICACMLFFFFKLCLHCINTPSSTGYWPDILYC